jgi:hypothetical protein
LVEHLIPPKHTATAQGEGVFFDIDVKMGEKEWFGMDATVGGPNRLAQSFRVYINAKGGDCWHVYKKSILVIDGKNNSNNDKQVGKEHQQTGRKGRTRTIEWQDQQCKLRRRKIVKA